MEYERFLDTATEEEAVEACRGADAVITCIQPFPKSVIERLDDSVSGRSAGMTGKSVRGNMTMWGTSPVILPDGYNSLWGPAGVRADRQERGSVHECVWRKGLHL